MSNSPVDPKFNSLFKSAKKRAQNEVAFQKTNDILMGQAKELVTGPARGEIAFAFTCECSNLQCYEEVHMSIKEFERISKHQAWFCIVPKHNQPDIENVIEEHDTHWVVAKLSGLLAPN